MNLFEEYMEELDSLDDDEKKQRIKEIEGDCVCPMCPTYTDCAKNKDHNVFCITSKSEECITRELGCLCPTCPLAQNFKIGVMYNFYCTRGGELEQRKG
jgi:hypothetical protein